MEILSGNFGPPNRNRERYQYQLALCKPLVVLMLQENSSDKERFIPDPDMQGLIERFVAAFFNNMRVEEWYEGISVMKW